MVLRQRNWNCTLMSNGLTCWNYQWWKCCWETWDKNNLIDILKPVLGLVESANKELTSASDSKLEECTNRQLCQAIVIKGLPEQGNKKWADVRNLLSKHVPKFYKVSCKKAFYLNSFCSVHANLFSRGEGVGKFWLRNTRGLGNYGHF